MMVQDERNFNLSVAGHLFHLCTLYTETYELCREYITDEQAEETIVITKEDIIAERDEAAKHGIVQHSAYLETLAVYRKIANKVLDYDTFLMHGAVIGYNNASYLFTAASGTGKTTHIKKWLDNLESSYVVNGDKPLIRITDDEALVYGTPWCGKEQMGKKCEVPLKAIVLMERGDNNKITEITFSQAFTGLLQQTYMPEDAGKMRKTLMLLSKLKGRVKFYKFVFNNMKEDAFIVAYNVLTEGNR